jgi:lipoyl(octanoyl) transferase
MTMPEQSPIILRTLGRRDYASVWRAMRAFTDGRDDDTPSELWLVEHPPVFTQGQAGKPEHLLDPGGIPVVQSDRGGQVTYHGPGQVVLYLLLDLRRAGLGIRALVTRMEEAVIGLLAEQGIDATARPDAPGVYVNGAKIASLGLRVRHGRSYHGLALNVDMDLSPFGRINPCGYRGLAVTQLADLGSSLDTGQAGETMARLLADRLNMCLSRTDVPNPALDAEADEGSAG